MPPSDAAVPAGSALRPGQVPDYLARTYRWAYLDRRLLPLLDRSWVVSTILWGNARRLMAAAIEEFEPGQRVLQAAAVYGPFSLLLARRLGREGLLEVVDVAPLQIANLRRKCFGMPQVRSRVQDLAQPLPARFGGVCCFFLLHEVPPDVRVAIVANLLAAVEPGGKAVFVDYHLPRPWHPLAGVMRWIFRHFEPYAPSLQAQEIRAIVPSPAGFAWSKRLCFGGLYQVVIATRGGDAADASAGGY